MKRMVLRISVGVLLALVASFLAIAGIASHSIVREMGEHPPPFVRAVAASAAMVLERASPGEIEAEARRLAERTGMAVELVPADDEGVPERARSSLGRGEPAWLHDPGGAGVAIYAPVPGGRRALVLSPEGWFRKVDMLAIGLMLAAVFVVVVVTGLALAGPVVRRLGRLETAAVRISAGDLDARAEVGPRDAVGSLAGSFNRMAERIQALLESQRQLLQAVSHELRTPLSRVRFGLEMLSEAGEGEDLARRADAIEGDLDELDALVDELLALARLDVEAPSLDKEPVEVAPLLADLASDIASRIDGPEVAIVPGAESECRIDGDPRLVERAVRNLLDNAARHAGSRVAVACRGEGDRVEIEVVDDGPGIPEADRERVLEPFSRLEGSRSKESGGAGLGLAIVARVLEAHGGSIEILDAAGGGARMVTRWPAVRPPGSDAGLG